MWSSEEVLSISTRGTPFDSGCRWYRADCKTKEMYWTAIFRCEPFSNSFFVTLSFNLGFRMFWLLSALCGWMTLRTRVSPISTVRQRADDKIWFATSFCSGWYSTYSYANYQLGKKQHGLIGRCCLWRLYKAALVLVFFYSGGRVQWVRRWGTGPSMRHRHLLRFVHSTVSTFHHSLIRQLSQSFAVPWIFQEFVGENHLVAGRRQFLRFKKKKRKKRQTRGGTEQTRDESKRETKQNRTCLHCKLPYEHIIELA